MKRISVAESALKKQIVLIRTKEQEINRKIDDLRIEVDSLASIRRQLGDEMDLLYSRRLTASEKVNP